MSKEKKPADRSGDRHVNKTLTLRPDFSLRQALAQRARKDRRRVTEMALLLLEEILTQKGDYTPPKIDDASSAD